MTTETAKKLIGQCIGYALGGMTDLTINCTITDVKTSYGQDRIEITPISGTGRRWINYTNALMEKETA